MAMTMPMSTNATIAICVQSQVGDMWHRLLRGTLRTPHGG